MVSYSRPRWLPWASPPPLPMEMAIITGTLFWAMRLSSAVNSDLSGPSAPTMNGAARAGHVLLGDINRNAPRVRSGMAGRHDQFGRGRRDRRVPNVFALPRDAGIELAVGRIHREVVHRPLRHACLHAISAAGLCVGPMMKFPSASAGGTSPSGNSLAVKLPGEAGSHFGGAGLRRRGDPRLPRPAAGSQKSAR